MPKPEDVVKRFEAGKVVPFQPKPGVPTLAIGGKRYVLSTDGGMLGDREDDAALQQELGDRVIMPPADANKWRYLWAYDTDKQVVAMWRVSDGSEKHWGPARGDTQTILKLDKKGQLNRVPTAEFSKIEAHMKTTEKEHEAALVQIIEENKGERERAIDRELAAMWKKLAPQLMAELAAVKQGAVPLGFKPFRPEGVERQAATFVIGQFFQRHFDYNKTVKALAAKIPTLNPELAGHYQDVMWAIDDLRDKQYEELLPPR